MKKILALLAALALALVVTSPATASGWTYGRHVTLDPQHRLTSTDLALCQSGERVLCIRLGNRPVWFGAHGKAHRFNGIRHFRAPVSANTLGLAALEQFRSGFDWSACRLVYGPDEYLFYGGHRALGLWHDTVVKCPGEVIGQPVAPRFTVGDTGPLSVIG